MKKKLISLILLCTICTGIIFSVSYTAHAQEHSIVPTTVQERGWGKVCQTAMDCIIGFICLLGECLPGGGDTEIGMCKSTNSNPCHFECGCGYKSTGTGPAETINHSCNK